MSSRITELYVRPVKGHLVPRYGTREFIGGRVQVGQPKRKKRGSVELDTETVVLLTEGFCRAHRQALRLHLKAGELELATREEYEAQRAARAKAKKERAEKLAEEAAEKARQEVAASPETPAEEQQDTTTEDPTAAPTARRKRKTKATSGGSEDAES